MTDQLQLNTEYKLKSSGPRDYGSHQIAVVKCSICNVCDTPVKLFK